jgi:hypothetical protein
MSFPTPHIQSQTSANLWKGLSFLAALATIVAPLFLGHHPAQADDFYQDSYDWNQSRFHDRFHNRSNNGPQLILRLPSQYRSSQSTTLYQNGQVIRIYEDSNGYRNHDRFFPFGNRRSLEFSIGNQGEFRQIERFPLNTWNQAQWNRPIDQSSFRYGFPNRHHRRW